MDGQLLKFDCLIVRRRNIFTVDHVLMNIESGYQMLVMQQ